MNKLPSLLLVVVLIVVLVLPVSAAEEESAWIELLETTTVNDSGVNWFSYTTTATISIPLPRQMRVSKVDMLISYTNGTKPTAVYAMYNSTLTKLDVVEIGTGVARVYGVFTNTFYSSLKIRFQRSATSTSTVEVLSCKISPLITEEFVADADVNLNGVTYPTNYSISVLGEGETHVDHDYQARISVYDWAKYDRLTIWGSVSDASIASMRATIGTVGLQMEINFLDAESSGGWASYYTSIYDAAKAESGDAAFTSWWRKYLYCVTIDLSDVDRTLADDPLFLYVTGSHDLVHGMLFNCQYVNGSITVADTTEVTWWTRFTTFMTDLFGADKSSGALDDLGSSSDSISQSASSIQDFEQSQQAVLDSNFATIQNGITFTNFATALVFVQKYANMTFNGISKYAIVLTLPLFLGLFFYLCSRIPGVTRWKTPPPRSKGGGDP